MAAMAIGRGHRIRTRTFPYLTIRARQPGGMRSTTTVSPKRTAPANRSYQWSQGKFGGHRQLRRPAARTRRKPRSKTRIAVLLVTMLRRSERPKSTPAKRTMLRRNAKPSWNSQW